MKRAKLFLLVVLYGGMLTLLAGCTAPNNQLQTGKNDQAPQHMGHKVVEPQTSAASLRTVDWANFTYSSSCYGNTQPFHARNGQATNTFIHFQVYSVKFGDLTNNGQTDAVVPYQCTAADAMGEHVFVYSGNAVHPVLLADLPAATEKGAIANVTEITISDGVLQLAGTGYSANAPHCCPDLSIRTNYKWNGSTFVATPISQTKI